MRRHPLGFTLIEVVFSLFVMAIGALTMALFLPSALRAHQFGRSQIYASAQASSLCDLFVSRAFAHDAAFFRAEACEPWQIPVGYRAFAPDLESRLASNKGGLIPLPPAIARRLDSENDEIARIVSSGGEIYYALPLPSREMHTDVNEAPLPGSEARRLVFAFNGYAQQNALGYIPWQAVPYRAAYPSPPQHAALNAATSATIEQNRHTLTRFPECSISGADDSDLDWVMATEFTQGTTDWDGTDDVVGLPSSGYAALLRIAESSAGAGKRVGPSWLRVKGYFALAWWYAIKKGLPLRFLYGDESITEAEISALGSNPEHVRALRILAHAAMCFTKDYTALPKLTASASTASTSTRWGHFVPPHPGLLAGVPVPGDDAANFNFPGPPAGGGVKNRLVSSPLTMTALYAIGNSATGSLPPFSGPATAVPLALYTSSFNGAALARSSLPGHIFVTQTMIQRWNELLLQVVMHAAAERPYDWRFPRPFNRMIMMDHPLVQFDVVATPVLPRLSGVIPGSGILPCPLSRLQAQQWRPIAAGDINGNVQTGINGFGVPGSATTTPWNSSNPVPWGSLAGDLSHFTLTHTFAAAERCREMVVWAVDWQAYEDAETAASAPVDASRYPLDQTYQPFTSTNEWLTRLPVFDHWQWEYRNPEKNLLFMQGMDLPFKSVPVPTGTIVRRYRIADDPFLNLNSGNEILSDNGGPPIVNRGINRGGAFAGTIRPDIGALGTTADAAGCTQARFVGLYGADRNANNILDRGPVPASVRMRATTVARFAFYDPRLYLSQR